MNSGLLYQQIIRLPGYFFKGGMSWKDQLNTAYLAVLSRYPSKEEAAAAKAYHDNLAPRMRWKFWQDLFWSLVNTAEFSYHH